MSTTILSAGRSRLLLGLSCLAILAGCAGPRCTPPTGLSPTTPAAVIATGGRIGERVRWGGALARVQHLRDSTEIEVVAYPLDGCGQPRLDAAPIGRFILIRSGFVETAGRPVGTLLSATGVIVGLRDGHLGEAPYAFPLLQGHSLSWWGHSSGARQATQGWPRPRVSIGIGGGSGGYYGGGIGVRF